MYPRIAEIRTGRETVLWRGQHPTHGRITIKEPSADLPSGERPRIVNQLERECRFLEQLSHDRIIRPVGWEDPGRILLEDTQGNLSQLLDREGTLGVDLVARVMTECLAGLAYLHDRKLAHGSLCPSSVLLGPKCDIKLGDFIGYRVDHGHAPIPPEYTLKYKAPELLTGVSSTDAAETRAARIDLYALGYLACELLSGREKFDRMFWPGGEPPAEGDANWLWWHGDPAKTLPPLPAILADVPGIMLGILSRLIDKDPARRPNSAREVLAALEESGLVSHRKLPSLETAPEPRRKRDEPEDDYPDDARRVTIVKKTYLELWAGDDALVHSVRFSPRKPGLVGRLAQCRWVIASPEVSEKHALLVCQDTGHWWIYDLGSRTKFRVNGEEKEAAELEAGTTLEIAGLSFKVRLTERPAPDVDKFELVKQLHAGQTGELYLARWRLDGRAAALRLFPPEFATNTEDIQRFLRGIPEAGKVRHPNLVAIYRAGFITRNDHRTWYLATEYLSGGSLRDRITDSGRPMPVDEVLRCGVDICSALAEVAKRKLVHRNVNPACVLFAADGTAKLGDFFLLRDEVVHTLHQITQATVPNGEYVYQAPEVLAGSRELTPGCDLYSLAACLYQALMRRPPFDPEQRLIGLLDQIQKQPVAAPRRYNPAIPERLEELLLWALDKDPARRPATPEKFRDMLADLLTAPGATTRPTRTRPS